MITAHTSTKSAVEALKAGALDYIAKPFDIDELKIIVRNARRAEGARGREPPPPHARSRSASRSPTSSASSARMQEIFSVVRRIAKTISTVLISGESGTGKELIARAIHYNSGRRGKFVSINCGALPETLLESELFGHERGAFTGAIREKRGLFHEADRGTIFLDEIGETSTAMQIKLLRVLQDHVVRRVGSNVETQVDVRVIAATNRDLAESIRDGDVPRGSLLSDQRHPHHAAAAAPAPRGHPAARRALHHQVSRRRSASRRSGSRPTPCALIEKYHWPGNVRELENVIERMIALEAVRRPHHEVAPRARPPRRRDSRHDVRSPARGDLARASPGVDRQVLHAQGARALPAACRPRPRSCCGCRSARSATTPRSTISSPRDGPGRERWRSKMRSSVVLLLACALACTQRVPLHRRAGDDHGSAPDTRRRRESSFRTNPSIHVEVAADDDTRAAGSDVSAIISPTTAG